MTDTWTWATVTQATPLRIKVDGDTTALDATTDDLVGSLAVDDRVRVHLHSDGIIVTGLQGGGNRSNPNLLINPNFIVNQEGNASGASLPGGSYLVDQWLNIGATSSLFTWADVAGVRTVTLGDASNWRAFRQALEQANFPAGVYTVSWEGDALARIYNVGAATPGWGSSPITVTLNGTANVYLDMQGNGRTINGWVKLEQGSSATPYQPPRYDDNLRACMRFYQRFQADGSTTRFGNGFAAGAVQLRFTVPLLVAMRTNAPTLTYNDLRAYDGETILAITALSVGGTAVNTAYVYGTVSGATQFRPYEFLANSASSFIAFDARL